jgi:NDP-sugar pyrophosphorylase family protein
MQIVLAVSDGYKLEGTLTDGDIRRAFLKGHNLESAIDAVIHRNPLVVPPEIGRDLVLQLMKINKIHQLPIVSPEGELVGLHVWDSIIAPDAIENMMIIMAGGKGTRLRPHTENCPKPMLEVGGKPMLEHIIERAIADGFKNFVISLHYLGHMIEEYFGNGSSYGINIEYLKEKSPLGTAGCLSLLPQLPNLPLIVTNGDVLTDIHYNEFLEFHNRHEATATMAVRQHEIQNQFGVIKTKGVEIEGFEEKPVYRSHVNAGIYVLNPNSLKYLEYEMHCDMPMLFERIKLNAGRTIVYPMHEPWLDVGRPDDLNIARKTFVDESE